jgi:predicted RNA-binding protein YlqC (UPF0109 family)
MKNILQSIVSSIVDNPDALSIEESTEEEVLQLVIHVDPADIGKVIGKEGKVIRAIRNVMKIPAMKQNMRIHVSVAEA